MTPSSRLFQPFPKENSTILVGNSRCGKSSYLKELFEHAKVYFEVPISKVFVINYNDCVKFEPLAGGQPTQTQEEDEEEEENHQYQYPPPLETFSPGQINLNQLPKNAIVIFEDVQSMDTSMLETINMLNHHLHLAHVFIVTQGLLSTTQFQLIQFVHSIIFFLCNKSVTKLFRYLISTTYKSADMVQYLQSIVNYCDDRDLPVHLLLNKSYQAPYHHLLIHVLKYHSHGYAVAFPFLNETSKYQDLCSKAKKMSLSDDSERPLTPPPKDLPKNAFIILDAQRVQSVFADESSDGEEEEKENGQRKRSKKETLTCTSMTEWNELREELNQWIDMSVNPKQHFKAKRMVEAIMNTPSLCVDAKVKKVKVEHQSNQEAISILDFIELSIRRKGPSEKYNPLYAKCLPIAQAMITAGSISKMAFVNEYVLNPPSFKKVKQQQKEQRQRSYTHLSPLPHSIYPSPSYYPPPYWPPPVHHG